MSLHIEQCMNAWKQLDALFYTDRVIRYTSVDISNVNQKLSKLLSFFDKRVFEHTPYKDVLSAKQVSHSDCLKIYEQVEKRLAFRTEIMVTLAHNEPLDASDISLYDLVHETTEEEKSSVCLAFLLARYGKFTPEHFPVLFDDIAQSVRDHTGASIAYYLCYCKFKHDVLRLTEVCKENLRDHLLVEKNDPGFNLLHVSAMADNKPFASMLVQRLGYTQIRSLVTRLDNKDRSPLYYVQSLGMTDFLLKIVGDDSTRRDLVVLQERGKGKTVLHHIVKRNLIDIYHALAPLVSDVSQLHDHRGQSPFMCTRSIEFYKSTKAMIDYPSLLDVNKNTFLHVLCSSEKNDSANSDLLDHVLRDNSKFGALVNAKNASGETPLNLAISNRMSMCLSILMQYSGHSEDQHMFFPISSQLVPQQAIEYAGTSSQLFDLVKDDNVSGLDCLERCFPVAQRRREIANMRDPKTGLTCLYEARSADMVHRLLVNWQAGTEIDRKTGMVKNPLPRQLEIMKHYIENRRERALVKYLKMRELDYKTWLWNSVHDLGDALFPADAEKSSEFVNAIKPIIRHVLEGKTQFRKNHREIVLQKDRREIVFRHLSHISLLDGVSVHERSTYMHSFLSVSDQVTVPSTGAENYTVNQDQLNRLVSGLVITKKTAEIVEDLDTTIVSLENTVDLFSKVAETGYMMDGMAILAENIPREALGRVVNNVIESEKTSENQTTLFVVLSRSNVELTEDAVRNAARLDMYHLAPVIAFRTLLSSSRVPVLPIAIQATNYVFISSILATDRHYISNSHTSLLTDTDRVSGLTSVELAVNKMDWQIISLLLYVDDIKREENVALRLRMINSYREKHGDDTAWSRMKELAESYGYDV